MSAGPLNEPAFAMEPVTVPSEYGAAVSIDGSSSTPYAWASVVGLVILAPTSAPHPPFGPRGRRLATLLTLASSGSAFASTFRAALSRRTLLNCNGLRPMTFSESRFKGSCAHAGDTAEGFESWRFARWSQRYARTFRT